MMFHWCMLCLYTYPCVSVFVLVSLRCNSRLREIVWRGCGLTGPLKWKSIDTTCTECRYIDTYIYIINMHIYTYIASICEPNSKCLAFALRRKLQATTQEIMSAGNSLPRTKVVVSAVMYHVLPGLCDAILCLACRALLKLSGWLRLT